MATEDKTKVSVVIPAFNEEPNLPALTEKVADAIPDGYELELIFVDDGSSDGTLGAIKDLQRSHPSISYISFSRNFGHQAALRAGIREARGDCVISMDADLQHPPELLPVMLERWREGSDVVYTRRGAGAERPSRLKGATSRLFYRVLRWLSGLDIDQGAADFRLIDRVVADVLDSMPERNLFLRGFVAWSGFSVEAIDYEPDPRLAGTSKYTFGRMLSLALGGLTQFSIRPLRLASFLGFLSAVLGVAYGLVAIIRHFAGHTVAGWTSVIVAVLILGGAQLMILGIIGEYLGWTFLESKRRPDYIIRERG